MPKMYDDNMTGNNILFDEMSLEQLIEVFQTKTSEISDKFDQITQELKKVDDNPEIWVSDTQKAFKEKKDIYVKQLPETVNEFNKQLELLKKARDDFRKTEKIIKSSVDKAINDLKI